MVRATFEFLARAARDSPLMLTPVLIKPAYRTGSRQYVFEPKANLGVASSTNICFWAF